MELTTYPVNFVPTSASAGFRKWIGRRSHAFQFACAGDVWWVRRLPSGRHALGVMTDVIYRWDLDAAVYCGEAPWYDPWTHVESAVERGMTAG